MNKTDFENKALQFLIQLQEKMSQSNISLEKHWSVDHLCYRVESLDRYFQMKEILSDFADLLIESEVNGRLISTYKLKSPTCMGDRRIDLIELPQPKKGKVLKEGFEHIEVVIDQNFSEIQKKYSQCKFKKTGISKDFNAELAITLENDVIKFHHLSLESVIRLELNQKVNTALIQSQVLSLLKDYQPLVAGTFPLGIETIDSDIDILLSSDDLNEFLTLVEKYFSGLCKYEAYIEKEEGYAICKFELNGVSFELYCENVETPQQRAYKHFQVEERLLRLGGEVFRKKIISKRKEGKKTEPAFAEVLNLKGDPFLALLDLHELSEEELLSIIQRVL